MKKSVMLVSIVLLSLSAFAFGASMQSLSKAQTTQQIAGKTITTIPLITLNDQLIANSFTGFFDKNGQMKGQLASKPDNDPQTDEGKWIVKPDGTLCATWQHWHQNKPICVSIYKLTNGMLLVNQHNKKIETLILKENIKDGNQLS